MRLTSLNSKPLVTLCITAYNTAEYIDKCLMTVCRQSYSNLEILITDDCSTDDTLKIIKQYATKDPRITIISNQENIGMNASISYMYTVANGEYLCSVDSDDMIEPNCVEVCVQTLLENQHIGMVYTHSAYCGAKSGRTYFNIEPFRRELLLEYLPCFHFRLFRAELWNYIREFRDDAEGGWDVELVMRLSLLTNFKEIPKILYHWRIHKDQHHISKESRSSFNILKQWYKSQLTKLNLNKNDIT